jgi:glycosyltransferase involved in cell wall biosynthesis
MGTPKLSIADIECPLGTPWRIESGGDLYRRYLVETLRKRFNAEPLGILLGRGNWLFQRAKLAYRLFGLKGVNDVWIRGFLSTITLPADRTVGKNILLIHHIDIRDTYEPVTSTLLLGKSYLLERFFYRNLNKVDAVVAVSKYWKEHFEARGHPNVRVIYNPFEVGSFTFTEQEIADFTRRHGLEGKPTVYIGNCQRGKGVIESYEHLKGMGLNLVTSGDRKVNIPAMHFSFDYRDYQRLLKASSVVVTMSKLREGWSRTAHEAMLCRTPVVGSGVCGMKELLDGGQQIVCRSFGELRQCVEYALEHPELGEKGYEFARNFTVERFESDWVGLIEEVAGS